MKMLRWSMKMRFAAALPLLLLLTACGGQSAAEPTADAVAQTVQSTATDTGVVSAEGQVVPSRSADLAFQVGGVVAEVLAEEGQLVAAGDPLVRLDAAAVESGVRQAQAGLDAANANLRAAQAQLSLAQTQRESAEAAVALAEAQLALVKAGARPEQVLAAEQSVAAAEAGIARANGERAAALDVSDARVQAAQAQLAAADAQLAALQEAYDTILTTCVELPDGSEVCPLLGAPEENTRYQLEAARASREAALLNAQQTQAGPTEGQRRVADAGVGLATAQRDLAQAQLDLLLAGARDEQVRQAEVGVAQARLGVEQAEVAAEQAAAAVTQAEAGLMNAQARLDAANLALSRMTLTAPFAGMVGDVLVEKGELVGPGVPVASVADAGGWFVETTDLVELDVVYVVPGQSVEVTLDALPGERLRGVISDVSQAPQLTRGDVVYRVMIDLEDYPALPLRWGMTALVSIDVE